MNYLFIMFVQSIAKHFIFWLFLFPFFAAGQTDSPKKEDWYNLHFQFTSVVQSHPDFTAKYTGANSLLTHEKAQMTITATAFLGAKLWKGAEIYFNPEIAGGSGFSGAKGIAGFSNGESFRVGSPAPKIYVARAMFKQVFALSNDDDTLTDEGVKAQHSDEANHLSYIHPKKYLFLVAGKFCMSDYFDLNKYSHEARTQFLNWALMSNGAWDYPANVRGYTQGIVLGYESPGFDLRISAVQVPNTANGADLESDLANAHNETIELEKKYKIGKQRGAVKLMGFYTHAPMGNYRNAIDTAIKNGGAPDIDAVHRKNNTKYGLTLNIQQDIGDNVGCFARVGWNDGQNETWAYTEIDQTASFGLWLGGSLWKRPDDNFGIAQVVNGISSQHQAYLRAGGYGFIIGDGYLNYAPEYITELYYNFKFGKHNLWLSPDYQLVINPAYNADRAGPVHIFSLRGHVEF